MLHYDHTIDDPGENGWLDPGETIDLATVLKNYGPAARNVEAVLSTSDPFLVIHDGHSVFGDVGEGELADNAADPYSLEAMPYAPQGHLAELVLTATYEGGQDVSRFVLCIGKFDYLVWDPTPDCSSGPVLDNTIRALDYSGHFATQLPLEQLQRYRSIFVSLGIYDSNFVISSGSPEANALIDYLSSDEAAVYLEGGDVWHYDPQVGGYNFGPLFGISAVADGEGDFRAAVGQVGTFTEGMSIPYSGENNWMDHINPVGGAIQILRNSTPVYGCGVAKETPTARTIGASFEFGSLQDGGAPSTKADLARAIMEFFLPIDPQGVAAEDASDGAGTRLSPARPNLVSDRARIHYALASAGRVRLGVYDASGRCVRQLVDASQPAGNYTLDFRGGELASGAYFIRLQAGDRAIARRCTVIR